MVEIMVSDTLLAEAFSKFPEVNCTIDDGVVVDFNSFRRQHWLWEMTVTKDEKSEILGAPL